MKYASKCRKNNYLISCFLFKITSFSFILYFSCLYLFLYYFPIFSHINFCRLCWSELRETAASVLSSYHPIHYKTCRVSRKWFHKWTYQYMWMNTWLEDEMKSTSRWWSLMVAVFSLFRITTERSGWKEILDFQSVNQTIFNVKVSTETQVANLWLYCDLQTWVVHLT